LVNERTGVS